MHTSGNGTLSFIFVPPKRNDATGAVAGSFQLNNETLIQSTRQDRSGEQCPPGVGKVMTGAGSLDVAFTISTAGTDDPSTSQGSISKSVDGPRTRELVEDEFPAEDEAFPEDELAAVAQLPKDPTGDSEGWYSSDEECAQSGRGDQRESAGDPKPPGMSITSGQAASAAWAVFRLQRNARRVVRRALVKWRLEAMRAESTDGESEARREGSGTGAPSEELQGRGVSLGSPGTSDGSWETAMDRALLRRRGSGSGRDDRVRQGAEVEIGRLEPRGEAAEGGAMSQVEQSLGAARKQLDEIGSLIQRLGSVGKCGDDNSFDDSSDEGSEGDCAGGAAGFAKRGPERGEAARFGVEPKIKQNLELKPSSTAREVAEVPPPKLPPRPQTRPPRGVPQRRTLVQSRSAGRSGPDPPPPPSMARTAADSRAAAGTGAAGAKGCATP